VKASFNKAYPGITGNWEKEKGNYEVGFKHANQTMSLLIDSRGNILETETDMSARLLPASILSYMRSHYRGNKITEAAKIVKADGQVTYEAEIKGKDVLFDSNGKFLKTEKTEAGDKEDGDKEND
jgi:hypothetical protein